MLRREVEGVDDLAEDELTELRTEDSNEGVCDVVRFFVYATPSCCPLWRCIGGDADGVRSGTRFSNIVFSPFVLTVVLARGPSEPITACGWTQASEH